MLREFKTKFRGKTWTVTPYAFIDKRDDGECVHDANRIHVDGSVSGKERLHTLVHEGNHASLPDLSEDCITQISAEQTEYLWKANVRVIEGDE